MVKLPTTEKGQPSILQAKNWKSGDAKRKRKKRTQISGGKRVDTSDTALGGKRSPGGYSSKDQQSKGKMGGAIDQRYVNVVQKERSNGKGVEGGGIYSEKGTWAAIDLRNMFRSLRPTYFAIKKMGRSWVQL